ncbi:MAG TPA: J domain-containing protein [Egibacteraceae bacterium]|nr:J domain-containing protein [Egibacteraceae bacterium]
MPGDHYEALGVHRWADPRAIRAAYLQAMREHHPDRRPGDPAAAAVARRANAAWEVLSDPARRAAYDRARSPGPALWPSGSARPPAHGAYSPERQRVRRDIDVACARVGVAVVSAGTALLLALG